MAVGNVRGNPLMRQRLVREDCRALMGLADVAMAVEIRVPRYNRAFRRAAAAEGKRPYFERSANQVAAPRGWGQLHGQRHVLTKGAAWIPQPKREACVLLDPAEKVAYVAVHMTNGAWNRKRKPFKRARQRRWLVQECGVSRLVADLVAEGYTVIVGGDLNTGPLRPSASFHPRQRVAARAGLMWALVVPADGAEARVAERRVVRDVNTDHPFLRVKIRVRAAD